MPRKPVHSPARPGSTPEDPYGPSDTSDMPSERPPGESDPGTDAQGTGARPAAEPPFLRPDSDAEDIAPDREVGPDEAGLAHTPPDPVRNGARRRN